MKKQRINLKSTIRICILFILLFATILGMPKIASAMTPSSYRTGSYEYSAIQSRDISNVYTIYRHKLGSSQKQNLTVVIGSSLTLQKVYNNSLYFEVGQIGHPDLSNVYKYNFKTKKMICIRKNVDISGKSGKYLCISSCSYAPSSVRFWVYNMKTGKSKETQYRVYNRFKAQIIGDKLYYAIKNGNMMKIRCKDLRTGKERNLTSEFKANFLVKITSKYVSYTYNDNGHSVARRKTLNI